MAILKTTQYVVQDIADYFKGSSNEDDRPSLRQERGRRHSQSRHQTLRQKFRGRSLSGLSAQHRTAGSLGRHGRAQDDFDHDYRKPQRRHTVGSITRQNLRERLKAWGPSLTERKRSPIRYHLIGHGFVNHRDSIEHLRGRRASPTGSRRLVEHSHSRSRSREKIRRRKSASHKYYSRSKHRTSNTQFDADMPPTPQVPGNWTNGTRNSRTTQTTRQSPPSGPGPPNPWSNLPRNSRILTPKAGDEQIFYIQKGAEGRPEIIKYESGSSSHCQIELSPPIREEANRQMTLKAQNKYKEREAAKNDVARVSNHIRERQMKAESAKKGINNPVWKELEVHQKAQKQAEIDRKGRERREKLAQDKAASAAAAHREKDRKNREKHEASVRKAAAAQKLKDQRAALAVQLPARGIRSPGNSIKGVRDELLRHGGGPPRDSQRNNPTPHPRVRDQLPALLNAANLATRNEDFIPVGQASTLNRGIGNMNRTYLEGMVPQEEIDAWEREERSGNRAA